MPSADPLGGYVRHLDSPAVAPRGLRSEWRKERIVASAGTESGYRWQRRTADLWLEAWAPSREKCVAQAVRGLVDSVAKVARGAVNAAGDPVSTVEFEIGGETDEELLVGVLDEVIYRMDVSGQVPVTSTVRAGSRGLDVTCGMAELRTLGAGARAGGAPSGAPPRQRRTASLHAPRMSAGPGYWSCAVTLEV
ncbi:MAG: archease [Actinophytocola sp.]|nr:archease [Actinophytocola sp.]